MDLLSSFKHKVFVAQNISISEWLLLVEAWWILLGFYLALLFMSYDRLNKWMPSLLRKKSNSFAHQAFAERLKQLVDISSRLHLLPMTCLVRSLALRWMLSRCGIPVQLCIGVSKTLIGMHAHAWVEIYGQPIGDAQDVAERFKKLT